MDRGTYLRLFADRTINSVAVFLDPGDPRRLHILDQIRKKARQHGLPVSNREQFYGNILAIFDSTFAITRSMRFLAIIIAFFGIAGALMTLFLERKSEYGILRALGLSTGQVAFMTLLEAIGMGIMSFLLSAGSGTLFAFILIRVINLRSFNWTIFFPPTPFPLSSHRPDSPSGQFRSGAISDNGWFCGLIRRCRYG